MSAYALFFRDTQAAIKGQNPNATFGELSKIVAAMWEGLDPNNKNVGYLQFYDVLRISELFICLHAIVSTCFTCFLDWLVFSLLICY